MTEFLVLTFLVCVAPLVVLAVLESTSRRNEASLRGARCERSRLVRSPTVGWGWRASAYKRPLPSEGLSRSRVRAYTYTGPWEDGACLPDFVSERIRWLSHLR